MRIAKIIVTFLFLIIAGRMLNAYDKQHYLLRQLSVNEGLSQNSVNCIIQDRAGFVWLGTKDGLNRYDGSEFRTFYVSGGVPGNNYVNALCEAEDGRIWIGTRNGLCCFDPLTEEASRCDVIRNDEVPINLEINQIVKGNDGTIYMPLDKNGIIIIDTITREPQWYDLDIRSICFDSSGMAYVIMSDNEMYTSSDGLKTLNFQRWDLASKLKGLQVGGTKFIRGRICSASGSPFYIDIETKQIFRFASVQVNDIACLSTGDTWVCTEDGIIVFDDHFEKKEEIHAEIGDRNALHDNIIQSVCEDRSGGVWTGTYFCGAFYFANNYAEIRHFSPTFSLKDMGERVRKIVPDEDGTIWIASEDKALMHYIPKEDTFEYFADLFRDKGVSMNIHGLLNDGKYIYVGTTSLEDPLLRFDKSTHKITKIETGTSITSLLKTNDSLIWIGMSEGLQTFNSRSGTVTDIQEVTSYVENLYEDSSNNVWISTYGDGLWKYEVASKAWKHYLFDPADSAALSDDKVLIVFEDSHSNIWISTDGGGICRYDKSADSFHKMKSILPFFTAYAIIEDKNGTLWMTTNNGLVNFSPESGKCAVYDAADGILSDQFNYDSGAIGSDGRIYLGTSFGIASFNPSGLSSNIAITEPIMFTGITGKWNMSKDGKKLSRRSPNGSSITYSDKISLKRKYNSFVIGVSKLDFMRPRNYGLMYSIDGEDWYPVTHNEIAFNNIRPGRYNLTVRSVLKDGTPAGDDKTLRIIVKRSLFEGIPAKIIYTLIFASCFILLSSFIRRRKINIERAKIEKENFIQERNLYSSKINFFTNVAHEIKTPLALIQAPLEDIKDSLSASKNIRILDDINTVLKSTKNLADLVNQLLDFRKIESGGYVMHFRTVNVSELLESQITLFSFMAKAERIRISADIPERPVMAVADEQSLARIFSNMLSNGLKYGSAFIKLKLETCDDSFVLTMSNDGEIVPLQYRESIFPPFSRYTSGDSDVSGTGIGLALCRVLVELHHGTITMDDDLTVNRFILTMPLQQDIQEGATSKLVSPSEEQHIGYGHEESMLVIEDDADMRDFLSRVFGEKFNVTTAENGIVALKKLEEKDFDIIISDVMMPEMNGFEFCKRVKEDIRYNHIPIILLTAKSDANSKIEGLHYGADAYVDKPFSVRYLESEVDSILENRKLLRKHFSELCHGAISEPSPAQPEQSDELFGKLNKYIDDNIDNPDLTVNDLASAVFMSPTSLFRKLKALTGMTPNEYLKMRRLKMAADLLKMKNLSVSEIGERVGFSSHSYFSSCFKKQYGVSPQAYQNSLE